MDIDSFGSFVISIDIDEGNTCFKSKYFSN